MHIKQLLSPRHFAKEELLLNPVLRYVLTVCIVSGQYRGEIVVGWMVREILEIQLYLKRQMPQCKESILGRIDNKENAKEAEIE